MGTGLCCVGTEDLELFSIPAHSTVCLFHFSNVLGIFSLSRSNLRHLGQHFTHSPILVTFPWCEVSVLRACLHGGGGPQVDEVTRLGGVTRLSM